MGVHRGHECGNQQPIHVIGVSLHLVHAAYAIGASHQVAGAPDVGRTDPGIRTEATDADATIFVAIGAYSGGSRACSWFSRSLSPPW